MPYTPLIPLPKGEEATESPPDPFDVLLDAPNDSISLFSTQPLPISTSSRHASRPSVSSASSDFGSFVSVSGGDDPLSSKDILSFSPVMSNAIEPLANVPFVDEAKQRTEDSERRVKDELLWHEDDPLYFTRPRKTLLEGVETPRDVSTPRLSGPSSASVPVSGPSSLTTTPTISPTSSSPPPMSISPIPRNASSPVLSSSPPASSLSQRISATIPRKWTTLLSSASNFLPHEQESHHPAATHSVTLPALPTSISDLVSDIPITHFSPFAAQTYTPPTGAPGFTGDHNWDKGFEFTPKNKVGAPVKLLGRNENSRPVLPDDIVESIRAHLPPLYRLARTWNLLYSLDQHGISLSTFYHNVAAQNRDDGGAGCLIVIKDAKGGRFGVWVGDGIRRSEGERYYGSGESFLWKEMHGESQGEPPTSVKVFKWTGKNDYVALCVPDYISFGGGDGKYGLYLDSSLLDGSSARCPTFDNDVLCTTKTQTLAQTKKGNVRFECVGLEAWGIQR